MAVYTLCDVFYRIKWLALRHFQMHLPVSPKERYIIYFWHITQTPPVLEIAIVFFYFKRNWRTCDYSQNLGIYIWFALRCKAGWGISYLLSMQNVLFMYTHLHLTHLACVYTMCHQISEKNQSNCNKDSET